MRHKEIRVFPDPVLREKAQEVKRFDEGIREVIQRMRRIMQEAEGIGLAAPQIGILQRIIVGDTGEERVAIVNPEILQAEGEDVMEEGCLSIPGVYIEIRRPTWIKVRGIDENGDEKEWEIEGLLARVVQHEIDHLNGTLIVDYLSAREYMRFQREYERLMGDEEE
ncbi:peptide deformylase [bacterium]|nr:MAG: peptide deformylase [bacterium]